MRNKIIVIEDDQDNFEVIKTILSMDGFEVFESDSDKICTSIHTNEPSLILIDNWLGKGSGANICKNLKDNSETKNIPVILMSACNGLEKIAKDCKADGYLEKPFEIDDLTDLIKGAIMKCMNLRLLRS
jgi:DNA-binding response OmpR family regulator